LKAREGEICTEYTKTYFIVVRKRREERERDRERAVDTIITSKEKSNAPMPAGS
jgi:hypothetical protein